MKMGSSFKKAIFEEHIQKGLVEWAQKAKMKKGFRRNGNGLNQVGPKEEASPAAVQLELAEVVVKESEQGDAGTGAGIATTSVAEKDNVGEIHPATGSK